eukprot:1363296-Amorphochlora_amoeboformis.AAC.3
MACLVVGGLKLVPGFVSWCCLESASVRANETLTPLDEFLAIADEVLMFSNPTYLILTTKHLDLDDIAKHVVLQNPRRLLRIASSLY